jgi:hypothetical protein
MYGAVVAHSKNRACTALFVFSTLAVNDLLDAVVF